MANPLVSQLKVDNVTYDIKDSYLRDLLLTDVVDEKSTYIFRKTGGDKNSEIGDRNKEFINEIIGGSLVVNQWVQNGNFEDISAWTTSNSVLQVQNNIGTLIKNASTAYGTGYISQFIPLIASRKYLFRCEYKGGEGVSTIRLFNSGDISVSDTNWHTYYRFVNPVSDVPSYEIIFWIRQTTHESTLSLQLRNIVAIDITQLFGSSSIADYVYNKEQTTALSGINWLYEYFPILNGGYIPYSTGKIESICISKHITTKLNQYNPNAEKYMLGPYSIMNMVIGKTNKLYMTLQDKDTSIDVSDISFGFVTQGASLPLQTDSFRWVLTSQGIQFNHSNTSGGISTADGPNLLDGLIIYPPGDSAWDRLNARYDICISIDSDRNGEYELFQESIYPLDSSKELRGIFNIDSNGKLYSVGDTCKSDGNGVRWYGYYNMGDMVWGSYDDASYGKCYYATPPSPKVAWKGLSDEYTQVYVGYGSLNDREFTTYSGAQQAMFVRDDRYPTVESFKAGVNGKYVMYKLAAPVATESAIPIPNPQSCDAYGTEEYVDAKVESGERVLSIPVCCTTTYLAGINSDTSTLHVVDEDTETLYVFD